MIAKYPFYSKITVLKNNEYIRALSSAGRAVLLQSKGQEFESPRVHK